MRTWVAFVALALASTALLGAASSQVSSGAAADDLVDGLRPAEGRALVLQHCVLCHSTAIIISNHMSRERWDEAITWMQVKHNLWPLEPDDRALILDYLEATQGESALDGDPLDARSSPWAQPLYRPNPIW